MVTKEDRAFMTRFDNKLDGIDRRVQAVEIQVTGNGSGVGILDRIKSLEKHNEDDRRERIERQKQLDEERKARNVRLVGWMFAAVSATASIIGILLRAGVI